MKEEKEALPSAYPWLPSSSAGNGGGTEQASWWSGKKVVYTKGANNSRHAKEKHGLFCLSHLLLLS